MKAVVLILLAVFLLLFYGRGYVHDFDFGAHTIYFGLSYFLYWLLILMMYMIIPSVARGLWYKIPFLFACFMTFAQVVIQVDMRSRGVIPDNNWMSLPACGLALIISLIIFLAEKKINGGGS